MNSMSPTNSQTQFHSPLKEPGTDYVTVEPSGFMNQIQLVGTSQSDSKKAPILSPKRVVVKKSGSGIMKGVIPRAFTGSEI